MVNKKALIIVGLNYGDEGKGLSTDYLCRDSENAIVVRYNGGHQAGHCVVSNKGERHVFSNFGSGTLRYIPTYWSSFCTFSPSHFIEELSLLKVTPKIYVDLNCPVTTHYDVLFNRALEATRGHLRYGSCGIGYGATIDRNKNNGYSLLFRDLLQSNYDEKLLKIKSYYRKKVNIETAFNFDSFSSEEDFLFEKSIKTINKFVSEGIIIPTCEEKILGEGATWKTYIFEGAQGVLLDQNYGMKPYITKSNTTSKNAHVLIERQKNTKFDKAVYYVTRAYLTRHGGGPFRLQDAGFNLCNNFNETNVNNDYQGEFKCNYLDLDLLNFALNIDMNYSSQIDKNLIITCLDHLDTEYITYYQNNEKKIIHYTDFYKEMHCNFRTIKYSFNPCADFIE